jgi:hypothetical protein
VVWAWYGVNYLMGAGLHFYGFGSSNNDGLTVAVLVNLGLVIGAALRYKYPGGIASLFRRSPEAGPAAV